MQSINQLTLSGNLCRDAERKTLQSGTVVCEFSIAVNDRFKRGDEWVDEVSFVDVTMFGKPAEWAADLCKGDGVVLVGKIKQDRWEQDGQKRSKLKMVAVTAIPTAARERGDNTSQERPPARGEYSQTRGPTPRPDQPPPDEIPFALLWLLISISLGGIIG